MDVQRFGAIHSTTDSVVLIAMVMVTLILMPIGQHVPIVTVRMHSRTMRRNGAMKITMDSEAIRMETTQTIVQTKLDLQQRTDSVVLIVMVMAIRTRAIHSQMMVPNGKMLMVTTTGIIQMVTILTSSPTMHPNGEIPMAMDMETTLEVPTATASRTIQPNGRMRTTMGMETTSLTSMAMVSRKENPTFARKCTANQALHHLEDVLIPMAMATPTLMTHSRTSHCNGLTKMVMVLVTIRNSQMVIDASTCMERVQRMEC